jgi:hypothetical protein
MQRKLGLIGMLVLFASTTLVAQTPTRRALDLWLQAFNSGDRAKLTTFWNTYNPQWPQVDRELHVRKESGGLTLIKVASDDGKRLEAVVADAGEMFLGLSVEVRSVDPPKIDHIVLHGVPTQDGIVEPFASDRDLVQGIKARVDSLAAADKFAGTLIIARNGKVLMQAACGEADRAFHKRVNLDTQFRIGSMNKMFTAVAVLQLVEQKKLSLDGTVGDYWRDYPNHDVATKVTIRHLLTHTGGTGDIFTPEFNEHRLQIRRTSQFSVPEPVWANGVGTPEVQVLPKGPTGTVQSYRRCHRWPLPHDRHRCVNLVNSAAPIDQASGPHTRSPVRSDSVPRAKKLP